MKRIFIFLVISAFSIFGASGLSLCVNVDGYWGKWDNWYNLYTVYGNYGGFCCYWQGRYSFESNHPSEWEWRFTIKNYQAPTKKEKKEHLKKDIWYEYEGTFEYYITDEDQSIKKMFLEHGRPSVDPAHHKTEKGQMPCVKKTVPATIKIAPYKDHPKTYNIWFEGVGFGISLDNSHF